MSRRGEPGAPGAAAFENILATLIDGVGPIARVEVAVVGSDEWFPLFPADGVFDEQREEVNSDISALMPQGAGLLSIRVYDKANNFVVRNVAVR